MQIIVPMSGRGTRFVRAGYTKIKPLLEVDGKPIIEHVVRMFPGETDYVFICARDHLEETPLRGVLERLVPGARIVGIEPHRKGPVYAALQAEGDIKDAEPVILNYCDFSTYWDYAEFKRRMQTLKCDGCLTAYRGFHPHSLGPNLYAYVRESDNYLLEIQEKKCFTSQRMNEYASSGTYYFRAGALLKQYFKRALERDLQTNGEYYASMPYNLMVEDGFKIYIYELDHFLQWGTPEDLEEYQAWSNYFTRFTRWQPDLPPQSGTLLIPMAGLGARFRKEQYTDLKPLIPVAGVSMIQRVLRTLPPARQEVCVCLADHAASLRSALPRDLRILTVDRPTEGQACTCLLARDAVDPEAPLLIAPCDAALIYDPERYASLTRELDLDCIVWTFRNHPHANRNPGQYGWIRVGPDGIIQQVSCKVPLHEDVRHDPGIIGAFWFRRANLFAEATDRLIRENRRRNGEFYVDSVVQLLVEQGARAKIFDVMHYIGFGTPDDVRTYEYWNAYFQKTSPLSFAKEAAT